MRSLSIKEQNNALSYLYNVVNWRREDKSEEWIAAKLGFASPMRLYMEMKQKWEWPDWAVYPEPPNPKRLPRGTDKDATELPPASNALPILEEGKEELERALDALQFMRQWLKDGRFPTEGVYPKESGRFKAVFRKQDYDHPLRRAQWERDCEYWGQDPEVEFFEVPFDNTLAGGAAWYPHSFLGSTVATYALTGCPLDPLFEALAPTSPTEEDRKAINKKKEELLRKTRQLARMLRGEKVKDGPDPLAITPEEQVYDWYLQHPESLGRSEEELIDEFSKHKLNQLRSFRLPHTEGGDE